MLAIFQLCLQCNNKFRHSELIERCPNIGCLGEVRRIDENIIHAIAELRGKGYNTYHSCSGHVDIFKELYVVIEVPYDEDVEAHELFNLSMLDRSSSFTFSFDSDESLGRPILIVRGRPDSDFDDEYEMFSKLSDIQKEFFSWVRSLNKIEAPIERLRERSIKNAEGGQLH